MKTTPNRLVVTRYAARAFATLLVAGSMLTGCKTAGVYDPVKSDRVVSAITPALRETVTRVILNSPEHSDELAGYFRALGTVFCKMQATGQFTPEQLVTEIDKATGPLQQKIPQIAITLKNTSVMLFNIFLLQKLTAELPPDQWPAHLAKLFCQSIDGGLKDAKKPGVTP